MKKEKEKPFISERLSKLIYNPELPQDWKKLPDHKKLMMFHMLFLLLNKDFQRDFGEILDKWVPLLSDIEKGKDIQDNPWVSVLNTNRDKGYVLICPRKCRYRNSKITLDPVIVYTLLKRKELKNLRSISIAHSYGIGLKDSMYFFTFCEYPAAETAGCNIYNKIECKPL